MERLTYKFPSLTLANFAVNNIRKDKVGEVTNSQNGYITVETSNIPAVKQIVEGVRGSEIFREALMMAPTGVPVRPSSAAVARLVTHKVPMTFIKQYPMLKKKKDASPGSKIMWSADDNDLDLILAKDVASYAKDGWVIIENFNEQTMEVEILEAFKSSSVPAGASQEVHDKARRDNPYKVRLNKGVPAGARDEEAEIKIAEFIIGPSNKTNYVKVTKHPTNKNALLVTSGGSPRQISKSDFMSFINSYDKNNPKGKEHYSVDFEDGTYDFSIGEIWQKLFLGKSISPTARFTRTYPKTYSYPDWLKAISKSAMKEEVEIEEAKLTPDQLKKINQGLKGKILDKKNTKKEDMEESASKAALEDFMYALPKAAIEELRPVMKMKQGVGRMAKITAVLKKHGITQKFMGAFPTSVVNDYFDTFHGESVEENGEKIDEQSVARRLGQTIGALRHGKPTPKDRLDDLTRNRKGRDHWQKLQKDPTFLAQNAYAKKQEQDEIKRQIAHLKTFLTKEDVESVEEAKPMVGGQKKLDVNKNGKLDAKDFKLLRAKKEQVEVNEAAPAIKAGMKLRAKQNKSVSNGSVVKGEQYKVADAGKNKFDLIHLSIGFRKAIRNVDASVIQALMQNKVLG